MWPQPQNATCTNSFLSIDSSAFSFISVGIQSAVLDRAFARYSHITFVSVPPLFALNGSKAGVVSSLTVNVLLANDTLQMSMIENYSLVIPSGGGVAQLTAPSIFGALRGLETFAQLVSWQGPTLTDFGIQVCSIVDFPRFRYRSAMIDTSRHFVPIPTINAFVDAMAYSKMNVLHWHVTDDQSFPFASVSFPALAARGAWGAGRTDGSGPAVASAHTYQQADVQGVIAYAADRGVRVVPEFDTPGMRGVMARAMGDSCSALCPTGEPIYVTHRPHSELGPRPAWPSDAMLREWFS